MAKRQLRSDALPRAQHSLPSPPTKKRKTRETVKYLCYACDTERTSGTFPDYNPSSECDHLINTCKTCLKGWISAQIESGLFVTEDDDGKTFGIKCPQCPAVMRSVNIEIAGAKAAHRRFEVAERKHIADNTPGWRWCLNPDCGAGQIHEQQSPSAQSRAAKKPISKNGVEEMSAVICACNECGARACVICDRPWHEGETCSDYQLRIRDRVEEEDKSLAAIKRLTKKCPHCQRNIQKDGGCPEMHCTSCNKTFCWNCSLERCVCNANPHRPRT